MKTIVKSIVLATVAISAVALTGCSKKSEEIVVPDGKLVEILPAAGSSTGVISQCSVTSRAVINSGHDQDLKVAFARLDQKSETDATYPAYSDLAGVLTADWKQGFTASAATAIAFDAPQYYLTRTVNNNTKLVGWYPHLAANTFTAGVVTIAVDGANDIMLTQELTGNKEAADNFGATGKIFNFKHQLALLKFSVYAKDDAGKTVNGKFEGLSLKGQLAACSIELPGDQTSQVTFAYASAPDPVDMTMVARKADKTDAAITLPLELNVATLDADGTTVTAKNEQECGYALIAPVADGGKVTIAVETELGGVKDYDIKLPAGGFEAGKAYNITLCFTASGIEPTATITEWIKGDDVNIEL